MMEDKNRQIIGWSLLTMEQIQCSAVLFISFMLVCDTLKGHVCVLIFYLKKQYGETNRDKDERKLPFLAPTL